MGCKNAKIHVKSFRSMRRVCINHCIQYVFTTVESRANGLDCRHIHWLCIVCPAVTIIRLTLLTECNLIVIQPCTPHSVSDMCYTVIR